jgi:hypothetical protein
MPKTEDNWSAVDIDCGESHLYVQRMIGNELNETPSHSLASNEQNSNFDHICEFG